MENLLIGLEVMIIGFSVVVIILYLLYLILIAFSHLFAERKAENGEKTASIQANSVQLKKEKNDDPSLELIAVITASISSYLNISPQNFAIISVLPQSNNIKSEWVAAGRNNLLNQRRALLRQRRRMKI